MKVILVMLIHNALNKLNLMNDDDDQGNVGHKCSKKITGLFGSFSQMADSPHRASE